MLMAKLPTVTSLICFMQVLPENKTTQRLFMPSHKRRNGNCDPRDTKQMIPGSTEIDLEKSSQSKKLLKKPKSEFRKLMEPPGEDGYFGIFWGENRHRTS